MNNKALIKRLCSDFRFYAEKNLKIQDKLTGEVIPFVFNEAQIYANRMAEEQKARTGKVRANVLKARQQGMSTMIQGRAYHGTTTKKGYNAFVITHLAEATANLFAMAKRFHRESNPVLRPSTASDSQKTLVFDKLDSRYRVGTAGNEDTGVSTTNRFLHQSEVALWKNAASIAVGLAQSVPPADDTEIWRESTARGMGNFFHTQWKAAEMGLSDYINIFIPWYWSSEYSTPAPEDFEPNAEELEDVIPLFRPFINLKGEQIHALTHDQLYWRRLKMAELKTGPTVDEVALFRQEYPMTAAEAFMSSGVGGIITPKMVVRARACTNKGVGPVTMGVDPAWTGDRFSIAVRRGREVLEVRSWAGKEIETIGQRLSHVTTTYARWGPQQVYIDQGGGQDIASLCHEKGIPAIAIPFGGAPDDDDRYPNKRSEMWGRMAEWMNDESYPVNIPDSDTLQADLCAGLYQPDTNNRMAMLKKSLIKKELGYSPDEGDALALTFAMRTVSINDSIEVESGL